MKRSSRLAFAVVALAMPLGAAPIAEKKQPAVHAPLPPKLHIKSFTVVSPACGKEAQFRFEIQNLSATAYGSKENTGYMITDISSRRAFWQAVPAVSGGATVPITATLLRENIACPGDTCWEVSLSRTVSGTGADIPEWDGKTARVCAKTSCNPHATKSKAPCPFEIYSPMR